MAMEKAFDELKDTGDLTAEKTQGSLFSKTCT